VSVPATTSVKKLAAVTSVKASLVKSTAKKTKKTYKISWKKVSGASKYQIYVSKKAKGNYKKAAEVKKTSVKLKKKAGTYYIKVRACKNNKKSTGKFSKAYKLVVKK
jgi:copper chaperone CopZ